METLKDTDFHAFSGLASSSGIDPFLGRLRHEVGEPALGCSPPHTPFEWAEYHKWPSLSVLSVRIDTLASFAFFDREYADDREEERRAPGATSPLLQMTWLLSFGADRQTLQQPERSMDKAKGLPSAPRP
mmetsp:Transcript_92589/g.245958  ORF Transcript_92589/g.245958 Transcript_92589/m.245958 type:complete len:130 (-) Transcript_92589:142-531(-)